MTSFSRQYGVREMNIYFRIGRGLINRGCAWVIVFVTCLGSVHGGSMDAIMGAERAHDGEWRFSEWHSLPSIDDAGQDTIYALRLIDTGVRDTNYILIQFTRDGDSDRFPDSWIQTSYHEGVLGEDGVKLSHGHRCDTLTMIYTGARGQVLLQMFRVKEYEYVDRRERDKWRTMPLTGTQLGEWLCIQGNAADSSYMLWKASVKDETFEIRRFLYGTVRLADGFALTRMFAGKVSGNEGILNTKDVFIVRDGVLEAHPVFCERESATIGFDNIRIYFEEECDSLIIFFPAGNDRYRLLRFRR